MALRVSKMRWQRLRWVIRVRNVQVSILVKCHKTKCIFFIFTDLLKYANVNDVDFNVTQLVYFWPINKYIIAIVIAFLVTQNSHINQPDNLFSFYTIKFAWHELKFCYSTLQHFLLDSFHGRRYQIYTIYKKKPDIFSNSKTHCGK